MAVASLLLFFHLPCLFALFESTTITVNNVVLTLHVDPSRNLLQVDAVYPTAEGWVGFGLSENGTMAGADIMMAWLRDGTFEFSDSFERNATTTHVIFQRSLLTCDESGQDVDVTTAATRIIVAHGSVDGTGTLQPHDVTAAKASSPLTIITADQEAAIVVNCSALDPCQRFSVTASSTLPPTTVTNAPVIFITTYLFPSMTTEGFEAVRERVRLAFAGSLNTAAANVRFTNLVSRPDGLAVTASTRTLPSTMLASPSNTLTSNSLLLSVRGAARLAELPEVIQAPAPALSFGEEVATSNSAKKEVDYLLIGIVAATVVVCLVVVLLSRALLKHCQKLAEQGAYKVDEDNEANVMLTDMSLGPSNDYGYGAPSGSQPTLQLEMMSELNHAEC